MRSDASMMAAMHSTHADRGPASGKTLVVGLGKTGLSCARHLRRQGRAVAVMDSRETPPGLMQARDELPDVALLLGGFDAAAMEAADEIVVSPGVALAEPAIRRAAAAGIPVVGDVELFARAAQAPVIAITGSNGKSTVTTLVGLIARHAGRRAAVGGNLGDPVLDLLDEDVELYVLELSSFQLETTSSLRARVATVLNLSADHLDRYPDLASYAAAKARIFAHADIAVVNRDDAAAAALAAGMPVQIGFTLAKPAGDDYGILEQDGVRWIARGKQPLLPVTDVRLPGTHNLANCLAALALAEAAGLPLASAREVFASFGGLPHRSELVHEHAGVRWINDSKGTNPGATVAALTGLVPDPAAGKAVLIAGGDGKGADFGMLADVVRERVRGLVLIGRDAPRLEQVLAGLAPIEHAGDMEEAVRAAAGLAWRGDCVVLSPACASFDMFDNYEHRGRVFTEAVARWSR
jgi:UDP-N-acetylmuramoylalanine--D-glutamate ligase